MAWPESGALGDGALPTGAYLADDGSVCTLRLTSHRRFLAPIEYTVTTYAPQPELPHASTPTRSDQRTALPSPLRRYGANASRARTPDDAAHAALTRVYPTSMQLQETLVNCSSPAPAVRPPRAGHATPGQAVPRPLPSAFDAAAAAENDATDSEPGTPPCTPRLSKASPPPPPRRRAFRRPTAAAASGEADDAASLTNRKRLSPVALSPSALSSASAVSSASIRDQPPVGSSAAVRTVAAAVAAAASVSSGRATAGHRTMPSGDGTPPSKRARPDSEGSTPLSYGKERLSVLFPVRRHENYLTHEPLPLQPLRVSGAAAGHVTAH